MPEVKTYAQPKDSLGQTIIKIIFITLILLAAGVVIFGFVLQTFDPISFISSVLGLLIILALIGLAIQGLLSFLKPKLFSPTEDFRTTVIRISKKAKPFNVRDLYLRGEDMRTYAKWGTIEGVGFIPYVTSKPVIDKDGKPVYQKDSNGKIVMEKQWSQADGAFVTIPKVKTEQITDADGDTIFVTQRHKFPVNIFMRDLDIIRCNPKYHSDILGDVYIKDVNVTPYGEWLYPCKQWQNDIIHIMKENEAEAIVTTHRNNLDLVSNVTQMSLGSDPTFQKIMLAQSERLSSGLAPQGM